MSRMLLARIVACKALLDSADDTNVANISRLQSAAILSLLPKEHLEANVAADISQRIMDMRLRAEDKTSILQALAGKAPTNTRRQQQDFTSIYDWLPDSAWALLLDERISSDAKRHCDAVASRMCKRNRALSEDVVIAVACMLH
jgi:hypothetical protein